MPDSIITACPECNKKLRVAESMAGKKVRCRNCKHVFEVPAPEPEEVDPQERFRRELEAEFDPEVSGKGYGVTVVDIAARCPVCAAALEEEEQVICLNCGYNLRTRTRTDAKVVYETTGGDRFMWLLPGILCLLGVIALVTIDVLCMFKMKDWANTHMSWLKKDEGGWWLKPGAFTMFITLASAVVIIPMARFAWKRLVVNNRPPEVEKR